MNFERMEQQREKIKAKFKELMSLDKMQDEKNRKENNQKMVAEVLRKMAGDHIQQRNEKNKKPQVTKKSKELIYSKSDISRELARLKPYLKLPDLTCTTEEFQDFKLKQTTEDQERKMVQMIIYCNKKLCQNFDNKPNKSRDSKDIQRSDVHSHSSMLIFSQNTLANAVKKHNQGWTFELDYRNILDQKKEEHNQYSKFKCVYALMTTKVQLFTNLKFQTLIKTIQIHQIKRVSYLSQNQYEIIEIQLEDGMHQLGFLNQQQFRLFDSMLFLQKNMARTANTRLFSNQLIKNYYQGYQNPAQNSLQPNQ